MGICGCKLFDGTECTEETVWNDMCSECNDAYERFLANNDRWWDEEQGKRVDLMVIADAPTILEIESTDRKFMLRLIDFLNESKVQENSTVLRLKG